MGQEQKEYTWQLVAKMLPGEASSQELDELEKLLRTNPDLHYPLQIITTLWRASGPEEQKKAEEAFSRHLDRMTALRIENGHKSSGSGKSGGDSESGESGKGGDYGEYDEHGGSGEYGEYGETAPEENGAQSNKRKRRRWLTIGSGCAVAVIALAAGFLNYRPQQAQPTIATPQVSEIVTHEGSRTNVYLPDGTRVWLNAASKITYARDFGGNSRKSREVNLSGEAFFDVTRNSAKPFVIHTARVDIKVLGTSFNIKSYPKEKTTEAVLVNGSIEVEIRNKDENKTNKKIILKPNEKLIVDNDDSIALQPHKTLRRAANLMALTIRKPNYESTTGKMIETSWIDNKLIFQDEAFNDLAGQMEHWYGVTIHFAKPELEQLQFTGSFEQETIKQALDALKLTAKFNYTIEGNQINIY